VFVDLLQAKQNYERELLLHATDIESLTQVKQEASSIINLSYLCLTVDFLHETCTIVMSICQLNVD